MSADWAIRPLWAVDTETTGVNTDVDRIVEVAAVQIDPAGEVLQEWSTIVNPGIDIPTEAAVIHGISTTKAIAEGVPPADALARVTQIIYDATVAGEPVVIFNARFDLPLLIVEAHRHDVDFPLFAPVLDPYLIDRLVDREQSKRAAARRESFKWRKGRRQLALVALHYGVELTADDAHAALPDAIAAGRVMRKIVEKYPAVGDRSLAYLWLRQVRGHEEDRERFVDYMRCNRDPNFDTPVGWPIPVAAT